MAKIMVKNGNNNHRILLSNKARIILISQMKNHRCKLPMFPDLSHFKFRLEVTTEYR